MFSVELLQFTEVSACTGVWRELFTNIRSDQSIRDGEFDEVGVPHTSNWAFYFLVAQQLPVGQGLFFHEVSRSHHSW